MLCSGTALKAVLAGFQLLTFLSLLFLVASRDLHQSLHPNAGHADHSCAVTLLAAGGIEPACNSVLVPPPSEVICTFVAISLFLPDSLLPRLPHGRAPPVV